MEGNELTSPLKEDADEFKNEWKKDAEEGERDLDDAQKDANDRVCVACCCETTLHRYDLLYNVYVGAVCLPRSFYRPLHN